MKRLTQIIGIIVLCCVVLFLGTCAWQNCRQEPSPDAPKCKFTVVVVSTGKILFTDKISDVAGIITLYNYYENVKGKYVFREITLKLDRKIFGEIRVIER